MGTAPDVRVRLSAEGTKEVIDAFKKVQAEAERAGTRGARGLGALTEAAQGLRRILPALGFGAVIAGAVALARSALQTADQFAKLSRSTGISVETLSAYAHGAELSGISTEDLARALSRLSRAMNDAATGSREQQRNFEALGISIRNQDGSLRSLDDVLGDIADRFAAMPDGTRKAALAQEFFGRSGAQLIPFLNQGRAGLAEFRAEAERLGIVIDAETALAAEHFNDNLKRLGQTIQGFIIAQGGPLLSMINDITDALLRATAQSDDLGLSLSQRLVGKVLTASAFVNAFMRRFPLAPGAPRPDRSFRELFEEELAIASEFLFPRPEGPAEKPKPTVERPIIDEGEIQRRLQAAKRLAEAELAFRRSGLENELRLAQLQSRLLAEEEKKRFDEGLTGVQEFFQRRRAALEEEGARELDILSRQADELRARIEEVSRRPLEPREEEAARQAELVALRQQLARVENEADLKRLEFLGKFGALTHEEQEAIRAFNRERLQAEAQLLEAAGDRFAAERANLAAQLAGLERLKGESEAAFAGRQEALRQAGEARIAFDELVHKGEQAMRELEARRLEIELVVQQGLISEFEGQERIAQIERSRLPILQAIAAAMAAGAISEEQKQQAEDLAQALDKLAASANLAGQRAAELRRNLEQALTSDLADWLDRGILEAENLGDAFRSLALSIVESIRKIIAQMIAMWLMQRLLGAFFGAFGGGAAGEGAGGGAGGGFQTGGLIRGPRSSHRDNLWIRAEPDEWIAPRWLVKQPGMLQFFEDLRSMRLQPRDINDFRFRGFAEGGLILDGTPGAPGGPGVPGVGGEARMIIGVDETAFLKRLEASPEFPRVLIRIADRHRKKLNNALGRGVQ